MSPCVYILLPGLQTGKTWKIPKAIVPRLNLAFTLAQSGDYKSAEKELEQILNLEPDEPAAKAKLEEIQQGPRPERRRGQSRGASA